MKPRGPNEWYHIAYAWDRSGLSSEAARLYVNGQLIGADAILSWIEPGEYFYLGGGNDGNTYGNGVWDDVRNYDFALSTAEVLFGMADSSVERPAFRRGDADDSGSVNVTDAVSVLNFLFGSGAEPVWYETGDINNDGAVNITDPVGVFSISCSVRASLRPRRASRPAAPTPTSPAHRRTSAAKRTRAAERPRDVQPQSVKASIATREEENSHGLNTDETRSSERNR